MNCIDLSGVWQCAIPGMEKPMTVPGTLDQSGIGFPDVGGKKWHPDTDTNLAPVSYTHLDVYKRQR